MRLQHHCSKAAIMPRSAFYGSLTATENTSNWTNLIFIPFKMSLSLSGWKTCNPAVDSTFMFFTLRRRPYSSLDFLTLLRSVHSPFSIPATNVTTSKVIEAYLRILMFLWPIFTPAVNSSIPAQLITNVPSKLRARTRSCPLAQLKYYLRSETYYSN